MFPSHLRTAVSVSCLLLLFACAAEPEPRRGELKPPVGPEEPLLELSYQGGMIANPDPTPFVRVYPGGRTEPESRTWVSPSRHRSPPPGPRAGAHVARSRAHAAGGRRDTPPTHPLPR